jgi:tripartite-type tricarboxylate transporter receptor subunit TctC
MRKPLLAVVLATTLGSIESVVAETYPSRPITMIVPFGTGGPMDTIGRLMAEGMRVSLGQPVIIENVAGASGSVGVGRVARAAPDGYTVAYGAWATHVVNLSPTESRFSRCLNQSFATHSSEFRTLARATGTSQRANSGHTPSAQSRG